MSFFSNDDPYRHKTQQKSYAHGRHASVCKISRRTTRRLGGERPQRK